MKKCPFCNEEIQDAAVKCRFCGEWLEKSDQLAAGGEGYKKLPSEEPRQAGTTQIVPKVSGVAKASFVISMIAIAFWVVAYYLCAIGVTLRVTEGAHNRTLITGGLLLYATLIANLVGAGLGFASFRKNITNKWMANTGIIVNIVEIVMFVALMIVGLSQR